MRFFVLLFALAAGFVGPAAPADVPGFGVPAFILTATPTTNANINSLMTPFTVTPTYGAPAITFSLVSGTFPTGVTLNATTGVVSGTPTQSGTFSNLVIGAEDSWSPAPHRTAQLPAYTMVVASPGGSFTCSATPTTTGTVGSAVTPFTVTSAGGTGPYTYSVYSRYLPSGVTIGASTGVVSGTPTEDGTYADIVIKSVDSLAAVGYCSSFTWVVNAASPAQAITYTATTPVPYVYLGSYAASSTLTMHGLTLNLRASYEPAIVGEIDADGNPTGSEWYAQATNFPPGYPSTPPYTLAPLVVNDFTTYPFRQNANSDLRIRGGRIIGSMSSYAEQFQLTLNPNSTTTGGIVTPGTLFACYGDVASYGPTKVNANVTGVSGASTFTTPSTTTFDALFVGEVVSNPGAQVGIQDGTTITSKSGTNVIHLSLPLTANITKVTATGCTTFYNNAAGGVFAYAPGFTASRMRLDHVWDGLRTCATDLYPAATPQHYCVGTTTGNWFTYARDDSFEDDHDMTLSITDTLIDKAWSGVSADGSYHGPTGSAETQEMITLTGVIMHITSRKDIFNSEVGAPDYPSYGIPFKLGADAPSITLVQTIIAMDQADVGHETRLAAGWQRMTNGIGSCTDATTNSITGLTGNYFLWLDDTPPTTAQIGTMATPGSTVRNCVTYQSGATARATLAAAIAAWQVAHPYIYRLSSDP